MTPGCDHGFGRTPINTVAYFLVVLKHPTEKTIERVRESTWISSKVQNNSLVLPHVDDDVVSLFSREGELGNFYQQQFVSFLKIASSQGMMLSLSVTHRLISALI